MKWTETFRINSHDCDSVGRVRPSLILRYMQETANLHLRAMGPTREELCSRDMAFILSRLSMGLYANLYAYDDITVYTWATASRGVSFNRCYEIKRNGELIAEASSVWGLIGISDKKIHRTDELTFSFSAGEPIEVPAPARVHIPKGLPLSLVGERPVVYSDLDANRHMNNTNYPDMLCDFIPDMENRQLCSMSIGFVSEARLGENLKVYAADQGEEYYFRTLRSDGSTNVEAVLGFEQ